MLGTHGSDQPHFARGGRYQVPPWLSAAASAPDALLWDAPASKAPPHILFDGWGGGAPAFPGTMSWFDTARLLTTLTTASRLTLAPRTWTWPCSIEMPVEVGARVREEGSRGSLPNSPLFCPKPGAAAGVGSPLGQCPSVPTPAPSSPHVPSPSPLSVATLKTPQAPCLPSHC